MTSPIQPRNVPEWTISTVVDAPPLAGLPLPKLVTAAGQGNLSAPKFILNWLHIGCMAHF
jgi:hypothetical protein